MEIGPHLLPPGGPEWWKVSLGTDGPLVLQKFMGFFHEDFMIKIHIDMVVSFQFTTEKILRFLKKNHCNLLSS